MASVKKILVIRNDRFGEFLLIIPALRALKESFPQAKITLGVDSSVACLVPGIEYADDMLIWDNKKHSIRESYFFSRRLRKEGFDISVVFNPAQSSHLACFMAGIPVRVGYDRKAGYLLNKKMKDLKALGLRHEVEYNLDLVRLAGGFTKNRDISLKVEDNTYFLEGLGAGRLVAVHPWTSDPVKQWPPEKFKELINRLSGVGVVLVGGKEELEKNKMFFEGLNERTLNLTGKTSLAELACVLKKADILVSGDSGPVHLAAAAGTPVVALFRNDLPGKTARRWGPWGNGHTVIERRCLEDISADEVARVVMDRLGLGAATYGGKR